MLKEIIHPKTQEYLLHIPKEYLNTEIGITNITPKVLSSQKMSLKSLLASWSPLNLNEGLPEIEDYPPINKDSFYEIKVYKDIISKKTVIPIIVTQNKGVCYDYANCKDS